GADEDRPERRCLRVLPPSAGVEVPRRGAGTADPHVVAPRGRRRRPGPAAGEERAGTRTGGLGQPPVRRGEPEWETERGTGDRTEDPALAHRRPEDSWRVEPGGGAVHRERGGLPCQRPGRRGGDEHSPAEARRR